uniref:Uncharacterized protein n=1 Tax=Cyprinus carpio carpio TaxID=630221 RepID=A0A8C1BHZ7_CYPCA
MFCGKQTRVLLLNDIERLERTLFRLEQGRYYCYSSFLIISCECTGVLCHFLWCL